MFFIEVMLFFLFDLFEFSCLYVYVHFYVFLSCSFVLNLW